jgi:hypothetical protein
VRLASIEAPGQQQANHGRAVLVRFALGTLTL